MESSMAEELMCSICLSLFQDPHMLRCGHNFCLSCLDSCIPGGRNKGKCPQCRRKFSRKEFTCNRPLANLAEKARQLQLNQDSLPAASTLGGVCEEHNEPLKLCCKQDLVPICVICRDLPQHQGHNFLPTQSAVKYAKTSTEEIMSHIYREFEVFHQILKEKEQDLKKTVEEMKAENLQKMEDGLRSLKEEESSHSEMNSKIKTAFEMADYFAFLRNFKQLIERVKEFQIWKPKDDDVSMKEEEECDEEEVQDNEEQHEDGDEEDFEEDEEDLWDLEISEEDEVGAGNGQVEIEVNIGDWEVEEEEEDVGRGGDGEVSRGGWRWRNILRDGSWRWGSILQRGGWSWGSILRRGGWRWGSILRGGGQRWGIIQRRSWRSGNIRDGRRGAGGWRWENFRNSRGDEYQQL